MTLLKSLSLNKVDSLNKFSFIFCSSSLEFTTKLTELCNLLKIYFLKSINDNLLYNDLTELDRTRIR